MDVSAQVAQEIIGGDLRVADINRAADFLCPAEDHACPDPALN
ncbi:hypothetical protein [Ponticoccus alexandrii]|nr:hypothetical protein [Ponticoccus alexandrii]